MRVGVPAPLFDLAASTGRGRMWHEVLGRLGRDVDLVPLADQGRAPRAFGRMRRRLDVVLYDGHTGPRPEPVPQVIQFHEAPWDDPVTTETLEAGFLELVVGPSQAAADIAAAVICPSTSARDEIVRFHGVDADRVVVAHHGVDHQIFRPGAAGGAALVGAHGGDGTRPWILFVGALHPRKNLAILRDAVTELAARGLPHQLVVVGGPAHARTDAAALAEALQAPLPGLPGRLVSIPFGTSDAELAGLMAGAAVLCLPSLAEGFGLPVAEAAACGTPTVVSNRGSLPEITGAGGLVVEPALDPVVAALQRVCTDPDLAARLGAAGIEQARRFTWDACGSRWRDALELATTGRLVPDTEPLPPDRPHPASNGAIASQT